MPRPQPQQTKRPQAGRSDEIAVRELMFKTGDVIKDALRVSDISQLTANLVALRNQWTIRHGEPSPAPEDERLQIAKSYLDLSPGANEVFQVWELLSQQSASHQHLALGVFASLLNLLSTHYIYHPLGLVVLKGLLDPESSRWLNAHMNSAQTDLVLVTLKLWNAMAEYAGGVERRRVFEAFAWGNKSLFRLFNMRRKGATDLGASPFAKPDIRTLYISFILGFLEPSEITSFNKPLLLESHRDTFLGIFKRLSEDPYLLVRKVLEVCWEGIWQDSKIRKTLKISLFGEQTLNSLLKVYTRASAETADPESIPADLVHHFLLALCTRPGTGICFRDNGWYPRDVEGADLMEDNSDRLDTRDGNGVSRGRDGGSRIYNRILAQLLKNLRPTDDARQQELAKRILQACPELVSGYWASCGLALEPRLSSKWLINISWIGSVLSVPVPVSSFLAPSSDGFAANPINQRQDYKSSPPPFNIVISNILPAIWSKTLISKGLQSTSPLVQRATALCLAQVLEKYDTVIKTFQEVERALEEDSTGGQWTTTRLELELEIKRRVPNFEVIVSFSQPKSTANPTQSDLGTGQIEEPGKDLKNAMLLECALRLMWFYHRSLPDIVSEARYDVGKLLLSGAIERPSLENGLIPTAGQDVDVNSSSRFDQLSLLHVLRLLERSDQFVWNAALGESNQGSIRRLLELYVTALPPAISANCSILLQSVLGQSALFEHDPSELPLWLEAMPRTSRASDVKRSGNEEPGDEKEFIISVLDKCIRECIKAPWAYVERAISVYNGSTLGNDKYTNIKSEALDDYSPSTAASPLLFKLIEEFQGMLKGEVKASASVVVTFSTYLRRLIFSLSLKQPDNRYALRLAAQLERLLLEHENPTVFALAINQGIRREISMLKNLLRRLELPETEKLPDEDERANLFLDETERASIESGRLRPTAYDLIDWIRIGDRQISKKSAARILNIINDWDPSALPEVLSQIDPSKTAMLSALLEGNMLRDMSFTSALLHASEIDLGRDDVIQSLSSLLAVEPSSRAGHACTALTRRLDIATNKVPADNGTIIYICKIWSNAVGQLGGTEKRAVHQQAALSSQGVQAMLHLAHVDLSLVRAIEQFIRSILDPSLDGDRMLAQPFCSYWITQISLDVEAARHLPPWIPYMSLGQTLQVFARLVAVINGTGSVLELLPMLHSLLRQLELHPDSAAVSECLIPILVMWTLFPDDVVIPKFLTMQGLRFVPFRTSQSHPPTSLGSQISNEAERNWKTAHHPVPIKVLDAVHDAISSDPAKALPVLYPFLYRSQNLRVKTSSLLKGEFGKTKLGLSILHHLLDASLLDDEYLTELCAHFTDRIVKLALAPGIYHGHTLHNRILIKMLHLSPAQQSLKAAVVNRYCQEDSTAGIALVTELARLKRLSPPDLRSILERTTPRLVPLMAEEGSEARSLVMKAITYLCSFYTGRLDLDESFFLEAVRQHIADADIMQTLASLVRISNLKPATVNRLLQAILHHELFEKTALSSSRNAIVDALHTLFHLHPHNTCQPSHVAPLIMIYRGTLSLADRRLLDIFRLFETTRKISCSSIVLQWTPTSTIASNGVLELILQLETSTLFATAVDFPQWRHLEELELQPNMRQSQDALYDPVFTLLLLSMAIQTVSTEFEMTGMDWVQLFRTNIVCVLISGLSTRDDSLRALAWNTFGGLLLSMNETDFQEKGQTMYILNMLARLYRSMEKTNHHSKADIGSLSKPPRMPTYTTLLFAHALQALYSPSSNLYPLISRFLLQRPDFDPHDPPMLYSMLYSTLESDIGKKDGTWRRERIWMIRFLANGMVSSKDWEVLQRRHTWDLLATVFQITRGESVFNTAILKVLSKITQNRRAKTSLLTRNNLLSWIGIQIHIGGQAIVGDKNLLAWFEILEGLLLDVDQDLIESRTRGLWRGEYVRCLQGLIQHLESGVSGMSTEISLSCLATASRTLQRVASLRCSASLLGRLLHKCLQVLRHIEKEVAIRNMSTTLEKDWLEVQLRLWLAMMTIAEARDGIGGSFNALSARVVSLRDLLVRSGAPFDDLQTCEWAKEMTLRMYSEAISP